MKQRVKIEKTLYTLGMIFKDRQGELRKECMKLDHTKGWEFFLGDDLMVYLGCWPA